jgi:FixJ family two-component response regulator
MGKESNSIIYLVEDDESVRRAMKRLILSMGMEIQTFSSGKIFFESTYRSHNACLICDVKMPGMGGMEIQKNLIRIGSKLPVIFITGFDTDQTRDEAKKVGAAGYFRKPVDDQALLDSIHWALSGQISPR